MPKDSNFFVTFPRSGTQTVPTGKSYIDFIKGTANLANGTTIPLANRSTQLNPLQSLYFYTNVDINIELHFGGALVYKGLVPKGHANFPGTEYDLLVITTTTATEISLTGSFDHLCIFSSTGLRASSTPTLYTVTMTTKDTEYSQALPDHTTKFEFRCRTKIDTRYAYLTGKVAGPTASYKSLLSGEVKSESNLDLSSVTLYFGCAIDAQVVELEVWT